LFLVEKEFGLIAQHITTTALNNRSDDNCSCAIIKYE
jgi:hypothetical protein